MHEMDTVVSLSVCLSTSDFEDGSVFMFENGHQRELGDNLSPFKKKRLYLRENKE